MKRRLSECLVIAGIIFFTLLAVMVLFERSATSIAYTALEPWFAICGAITPMSWQVTGNVLLVLTWIVSGVAAYSLVLAALIVIGLAVADRIRKED